MIKEIDPSPRIPKLIQDELRPKLKKMNGKNRFNNSKEAEGCAFDIQRLQNELKKSMAFHIGLIAPPGKLVLFNEIFN